MESGWGGEELRPTHSRLPVVGLTVILQPLLPDLSVRRLDHPSCLITMYSSMQIWNETSSTKNTRGGNWPTYSEWLVDKFSFLNPMSTANCVAAWVGGIHHMKYHMIS